MKRKDTVELEIYKLPNYQMSKLILNNNYFLKIDEDTRVPKRVKKNFNNYYKFIKKNETKIRFQNANITFTLWNNQKCDNYYICYVTFEKNNNLRITKNQLNENSVYIWVKIYDIQLLYLKAYECMRTLETFIFTVDFYNKINIKKNLKKIKSITNVFQNDYVVRYISEFL